MKKFSVLELLHPDGYASSALVLGSNCPGDLVPISTVGSDQKIELVILAPTSEECKSEEWLKESVALIGRRLSDDGVGYIIAPFPWRSKIVRQLHRAGLVIASSFWHFPDIASSQYLMPLEGGPAQYAVKTIVCAPAWKRALAIHIFRYPAARRVLSTLWAPIGISVRRANARPLFEWLFRLGQKQLEPTDIIIRRSWRDSDGASIFYCFSELDLLPSTIIKTRPGPDSPAQLEKEAAALATLAPDAVNAGAQIPKVLKTVQNDQRSSLWLTAMHGRSVSNLLHANPELLSPTLAQMVNWLERWHRLTLTVQPPKLDRFEKALLAPVELLSSQLDHASEYRGWLIDRIQAVAGSPLPLVATHNDLTMANILLDENDRLSIVDWETAEADGFPLVDFSYAVTDAFRIARSTTWLNAFKACHDSQNYFSSQVACWREQLQSAIEVSPSWAELCFHACWLHHAGNEHRVNLHDAPKPFFDIVQYLALRCAGFKENRN